MGVGLVGITGAEPRPLLAVGNGCNPEGDDCWLSTGVGAAGVENPPLVGELGRLGWFTNPNWLGG